MSAPSGRVLKSSEVKLEGTCQLQGGAGGTDTVSSAPRTSVTPKVRIVESDTDFALLEVTCRCGQRTLVRCEYAPQSAAAPA